MSELNNWVDNGNGDVEPNGAVMPSNDDLPGACRVQSPSSIITYNQCPRKYYYRYVEKLPGGTSIHLIRGSIVHKVLEDIFDIQAEKIPESNFFFTLKVILQERFREEWYNNAPALAALGLPPEELDEFFEDSKLMVDNFYHYLYDQMEPHVATMGVHHAWKHVTPQREVLMKSAQHLVRGYIDAVQTEGTGTDEKTVIIDYKTSKKCEITPDYRLQLGIYAMMQEELEKAPDEVGILFLKHGQELRMAVTPELINDAKEQCANVQLKTKSNTINDYPRKPSPLCKWRTGQCEFYEMCFHGRTAEEYREKMQLKRN